MRIRKCSMNSVFAPSPSSSVSAHSSAVTTNSIASSTDSSSSPPSSDSSSSSTRCEGLDLLVKAIHHVFSGSAVGVPYIQKRVVRRRRRALRFSKPIITELFKEEEVEELEEIENQGQAEAKSLPKRQRRLMALPSRYQDSVLQPWKMQTRRHQSIKIGDGSS